MYTNWEQDGSRQWETFLADELPNYLAANKGLAPNGHGIVGAAQGGYGAMTMATFHPDRYRFAGSLSGFLTPSSTAIERRHHRRPSAVRRRRHPQHVGFATVGPVEVARPGRARTTVVGQQHPAMGVQPRGDGVHDPAAMIGYCDQAQGSNRTFYQHYRNVGGHNGHFDFPPGGNHDWGSWSGQLAAMSGELVATIK